MNKTEIDEDFREFELKVNEVAKMIEDMQSTTKALAEGVPLPIKEEDNVAVANLTDEEPLIVRTCTNRTFINKKSATSSAPKKIAEKNPNEMDKFEFMKEVEKDANERAKAREERQNASQSFKSQGNDAFHKENYEKAILWYTKAIEQVKNSPILYNNRALSYIKMRNYKRALADCNNVINKLDEKNLRAWLYRAACYIRMGDEVNYEESLDSAREHNPDEDAYINNFLEKLKTDF